MPELTAVRVVVRGRVQGVGFRFATCRQADRLGVAGWVRNLPTGEVGVFAQGPSASVEALVEWLRRGPRGARVAGIDVTGAKVDPELGRFDLRY